MFTRTLLREGSHVLCTALFRQDRKHLPIFLLLSAALERRSRLSSVMLQLSTAVAVQLSSSTGYKFDTKLLSFMLTVLL